MQSLVAKLADARTEVIKAHDDKKAWKLAESAADLLELVTGSLRYDCETAGVHVAAAYVLSDLAERYPGESSKYYDLARRELSAAYNVVGIPKSAAKFEVAWWRDWREKKLDTFMENIATAESLFLTGSKKPSAGLMSSLKYLIVAGKYHNKHDWGKMRGAMEQYYNDVLSYTLLPKDKTFFKRRKIAQQTWERIKPWHKKIRSKQNAIGDLRVNPAKVSVTLFGPTVYVYPGGMTNNLRLTGTNVKYWEKEVANGLDMSIDEYFLHALASGEAVREACSHTPPVGTVTDEFVRPKLVADHMRHRSLVELGLPAKPLHSESEALGIENNIDLRRELWDYELSIGRVKMNDKGLIVKA